MIFAVGIILGVIAVAVAGYPFLSRRANGSSSGSSVEDEIERQVQQLRQNRQGKSQIVCPQCGSECDPKDGFCRNCGAHFQ
ncbi:MAG: zinc ribbon domain-containing protein [Dehalococcoidia bacterium]